MKKKAIFLGLLLTFLTVLSGMKLVAFVFAVLDAGAIQGGNFSRLAVTTLDVIWVPDNYTTIQAAIDAAHAGDTIIVRNGTYHENIKVNKTLELVGENFPVIRGRHLGFWGRPTVSILADNVTLTGFEIQHEVGEPEMDFGIDLMASKCNISGNIIRYNLEGITAGDNNFISNNTIEHNKGIAIGCSGLGNYISENVITNNGCGTFFPSPSNLLIKNTVSNNHEGIVIWDGNNIIYQNNFINNTSQVAVDVGLTNIWDNGYPSGGNYWSHYNGVDFYSGPYQNETGSDGISDTQYTIDATNKDNFPLMAPISTFDVGVWNGTAYDVDVITNSTLSNFQLDTTQKTMSFNVTGDAGLGFCRVTIPNLIIQNMWQGNYTVRVNGDLWAFRNWTTTENTYIYFTYQHPQNKITITPEFPSAIILPLFMAITMLALIFHTLKAKKKNPF